MAARALLVGDGLGQEAGPQAEARRDVLDAELRQDRLIGRLESPAGGQVELDQARPGLGVDRPELDPQARHGRAERGDQPLVGAERGEAVAERALGVAGGGIGDPELVLERAHRLVALLLQAGEGPAGNLAYGDLAGRSVRPGGIGEADAPARPPGELEQRVRVGLEPQIAGTGPDADGLVGRDRLVERVECEQQVGDGRPAPYGGFERGPAQRLAAQLAVHVRKAEQNVFALGRGGAHPGRVGVASASACLISRSASLSAAATRSTSAASSSSPAT